MTHWDKKKAGQLAEAIAAHLADLDTDTPDPELYKIMERAKAASAWDRTTALQQSSIHSSLCRYCSGNKLFNCAGHEYQIECQFVSSKLAVL